jgi:hypothetical protein
MSIEGPLWEEMTNDQNELSDHILGSVVCVRSISMVAMISALS